MPEVRPRKDSRGLKKVVRIDFSEDMSSTGVYAAYIPAWLGSRSVSSKTLEVETEK